MQNLVSYNLRLRVSKISFNTKQKQKRYTMKQKVHINVSNQWWWLKRWVVHLAGIVLECLAWQTACWDLDQLEYLQSASMDRSCSSSQGYYIGYSSAPGTEIYAQAVSENNTIYKHETKFYNSIVYMINASDNNKEHTVKAAKVMHLATGW